MSARTHDRWWERFSREQRGGDLWVVTHDGDNIAQFTGENSERDSRDFLESQIDPRNGQFVEGFIAGLDVFNADRDEHRKALIWLSAEQSKLTTGDTSIALDIYNEAMREGRKAAAGDAE